ncbi:MAG: 4-oxalomesaconate tautomerase [Delftia sp.]|uniref:4-oxalomesaconate tautomerase n=1 Tax=Delftia TaxID=80865 RepID=UPI0002F6C582|nr:MULTISPECIES: 4-oxalomesaconate tautomerase [Delftia]MPT05366.1 4-oxalomesaconate tautomerase [Delftia sp.]MPT55049.1 4-oxalomesaconate tautomerase [Delftia sp.]SFB65894.1 4-oxalomesaconate tautomerase [Delftia tsuruhatensis]
MQTAIPCLLMRGGTSKGPFFRASDLPSDLPTRDRVLLAAMGSPDRRQIDGVGGAHPLTSKVGIVSLSDKEGIDLEFLFAQLQPDKDTVDTTPNCGNMLAGVVPFALETGMVQPRGETSTFRVLTLNTGMAADITVQTPGGQVEYEGSARIDGAPGSSAPIEISFLDTAGSVCSGLLPTGKPRDTVTVTGEGFEPFTLDVTCIDNGMPLVIFKASDVGATGQETVAELNADTDLKRRIEALRLQISQAMGLGDVSAKNYPKMTLIAPPQHGGALTTRSFIPHVCHDAIGVLAAVTVGTAVKMPGTVCEGVAQLQQGTGPLTVSVEHPTGEFSVTLDSDPAHPDVVTKAALLRTARLLMRGEVMVPRSVWDGRRQD